MENFSAYNSTRVDPKIIIPEVTPCCTPQQCQREKGDSLVIDGDCINDEDRLTCPVHHKEIIFVFGTGWWNLLGGTFDKNPVWSVTCWECKKEYTVKAWSYRG